MFGSTRKQLTLPEMICLKYFAPSNDSSIPLDLINALHQAQKLCFTKGNFIGISEDAYFTKWKTTFVMATV